MLVRIMAFTVILLLFSYVKTLFQGLFALFSFVLLLFCSFTGFCFETDGCLIKFSHVVWLAAGL